MDPTTYSVFSTTIFLGDLHGLFDSNVLAFLLRVLHEWLRPPIAVPSIRADPRPVDAQGRLIIRRAFEPISFIIINRIHPVI